MFSEISQLCFVDSERAGKQFLNPCPSSRQHNLDIGVSVHYTQFLIQVGWYDVLI